MSAPGAGAPSLFSPYANLPDAKPAPLPDKEKADKAAAVLAAKRKRGEDLPKEWGWIKVPSISRPGKFSYMNKYTKEKIGWVPDREASRTRKNLPPAPKVEKKARLEPSQDPEAKLKQDQDTLCTVLEKTKGMLTSDDAKKFTTGLKVLHKSFHSSAAMTGPTVPLYYAVLGLSQAVPERHLATGNRRLIKQLFKVAREKRDLFDPANHYRLDSWIMRCVTHHELFTDDSHRYNAAVKVFREALMKAEITNKPRIEELAGTDADHEEITVPAADLVERKQIIIETMSTLESRAGLSWALPTVKSIFKDITDRRTLFTEDQCAAMDSACDLLQARLTGKRNQVLEGQNAGMMQGRVIPRRKF